MQWRCAENPKVVRVLPEDLVETVCENLLY
jgi:hypothetical protein